MEILATIPVYSYPWFYNLFLAAMFLLIAISLGVMAFSFISDKKITFLISIACIAIAVVGFIHTIKAIDRDTHISYNKYKITIDETISAQELLNKYEILSREGEIFTIKEIEVDE